MMFLSFCKPYVYYITRIDVLSIYCVGWIMKLRIIIDTLRKPLVSKQTNIYVSCAAYYLIVSFIPMTLFFFSVMSFLPFDANPEYFLRQFLPEELSDLLYELINWIGSPRSVSFLSVSGLITVCSASKSMMAVRNGLDYVMKISSGEHTLQSRLRAIYTLLPLPFLFYLILVSQVLITMVSEKVLYAFIPGFTHVVHYFKLYSILLLSLIFTILYRTIPSYRFPFRHCLWGAAITSILWSVLSILFSLYVKYISSYTTIYGIIGTVYLGLIWLHISIHIVFLGGRIIYLRSNDLYHPFRMIRDFFSG